MMIRQRKGAVILRLIKAVGCMPVKVYKKCLKPAAKAAGGLLVRIWRHRKGRAGLIMVAGIILVAVFAPLLAPYGVDDFDMSSRLQQPSWAHPLGTDKNGADILTQLIFGTRVSLMVGMITGISVTVLGAVLGIVAAYFGKAAGAVIIGIINVLMVIPTLPLMIILNKISSSYLMMIAIFVIFGWGGTARVVRAQVLSIKSMDYVKQAELAGAGKGYIMMRHILPAVSHLLIMNCALACAGFMIAEAGLSFIGLGDPSAVSWGKLLVNAEESAFTFGLWAWVLTPGIAIFVSVTAFMKIGYSLEEIFNPRLKMATRDNKSTRGDSDAEAEEVMRCIDLMDEDGTGCQGSCRVTGGESCGCDEEARY